MSRPASVLMMGASGASGAYLYSHSDILEDFMRDGTRGLIHNLSAPKSSKASGSGSGDVNELRHMVSELSSQMDSLASHQKNSHQVIVAAHQPASFLGFPLWKAIGLVGTAGTIYMKVKGYELKDLVYVSKKHFDKVTETLCEQYKNLEETVTVVKQEMLERIGLVETKVDEARDSIEAKIDSEIGNVNNQIEDLNAGLSKMDGTLQATNSQIENMTENMATLSTDISAIGSGIDTRLEVMQSEVEDIKASFDRNHDSVRGDITGLDSKIDGLNQATQLRLNGIQSGLQHQSEGIGLLCEFVSKAQQAQDKSGLYERLQEFARTEKRRVSDIPMTSRRAAPALTSRRQSEGLAGIRSSLYLTSN